MAYSVLVREQAQAPGEGRDLVKVEPEREDTIEEAMAEGQQPLVHHPADINGRSALSGQGHLIPPRSSAHPERSASPASRCDRPG